MTLAILLDRTIINGAKAQQAAPFVSQAQFDEWVGTLSNWGRWGPDDEIGTLNLITPEKRKEASSLVQNGVSAIIQPSGSIRDKEIIKFANKLGVVLVFSKTRHFKH